MYVIPSTLSLMDNNDNLDPDANFYTPMSQTKYYLEEEFNSTFGNQKYNFSLFHTNIRSLSKNLPDLIEYLSNLKHDFTIMGFTETWLNDLNVTHNTISGYNEFHSYRDSKRGGGVSLYVHEDFSGHRLDAVSMIEDCIETVFVEVMYKGNNSTLKSRKMIIGCVYRPPNSSYGDFMNKLEWCFSKVNIENKLCYILGDFNINLMNTDKAECNEFVDLMNSHALVPLIASPTRVTSESATLIDNIFSNSYVMNVDGQSGILCNDISDHYSVFYVSDLKCDNAPKHSHITIRRINPTTKDAFNTSMRNADWSSVMNTNDTQVAYSNFHAILTSAYNDAFPFRTVKIRNTKHPWLTLGILKSIKKKNKLYMYWKRNPTSYNKQKYDDYKHLLEKVKKCAKKMYYHNQLDKHSGNPRKTWNVLREVLGKPNNKGSPTPDIKVDDQVIDNAPDIASHFNNFFAHIGSELALKVPHTATDPIDYITANHADSFGLREVTNNEILEVGINLKNGSAGWDGFKPEIMKLALCNMLQPLNHIYNLSIRSGIIPRELKKAIVIPIHKSGDKSSMNNYRPISILSFFAKLLEKLIYRKAFSYLEKHKILHLHQFGFRQGRSTELALTRTFEIITNGLENNMNTLGVFLDFKKAFDTVDHSILLAKMYRYGFRGVSQMWFKNYLEDRVQCVRYDNCLSEEAVLSCGVPQGSTLGPLLFLIYINDLPNIMPNATTIMFADDTSIFLSDKDFLPVINELNNVLGNVYTWLCANKVALNISKTKAMLFSHQKLRDTDVPILINNQGVEFVEETTFLGLVVDNKLTWSRHIDSVAKKLSKSIGLLYKAKEVLRKASLISLYKSLVYPLLTYCNTLYGNAAVTHLNRLHVLQKKCIRIICNLPYRAHTTQYFRSLKLLNIYQLNDYLVSLFVYKCLNGYYPAELFKYFRQKRTTGLRNSNQLQEPVILKEVCRKHIQYNGVKLWNNLLQARFKCNVSIGIFKKTLKVHLSK